MRDQHESTRGMTMTWAPVRDARGRVRMEAHWVPAGTAAAATSKPHAA